MAGSIIPLAEEDGTIEKKVYPGKDASFNLYEDDGESYGYERGQYSITKLMWDDKQCKLDVEK